MAQTIINDGDSGLTVRNELNSMFAELYASITAPIKLPGNVGNVSQAIAANTMVKTIALSATSGAPKLRIGITANGQEIMPDTVIGNSQIIEAEYYFQNAGTLYFTITGAGTYSIRIDVQNAYY